MKQSETISWIFLSIALASKTNPATWEGIANIADGINHAVPTHKELQMSTSWLLANNLLIKQGKNYLLTEAGKNIIKDAESQSSLVLELWGILTNKLAIPALRIAADTGLCLMPAGV